MPIAATIPACSLRPFLPAAYDIPACSLRPFLPAAYDQSCLQPTTIPACSPRASIATFPFLFQNSHVPA
eukprot:1157570-Pelagomonas_calceolata.AAC.19